MTALFSPRCPRPDSDPPRPPHRPASTWTQSPAPRRWRRCEWRPTPEPLSSHSHLHRHCTFMDLRERLSFSAVFFIFFTEPELVQEIMEEVAPSGNSRKRLAPPPASPANRLPVRPFFFILHAEHGKPSADKKMFPLAHTRQARWTWRALSTSSVASASSRCGAATLTRGGAGIAGGAKRGPEGREGGSAEKRRTGRRERERGRGSAPIMQCTADWGMHHDGLYAE